MITFSTPKILHVTWKTREIPPQYKDYYSKWVDFTSDWDHRIYDDDDLRNFVKKYYPEYIEAYDGFTSHIERVDFARYAILHKLGGVYADLDTFPLRKIEQWLKVGKVVLGREPLEHSRQIYKREVVLCNAFMISPPGDEFWIKLMDFIVQNYRKYQNAVYTTGPMAMTLFYEKDPLSFEDVVITDPCVFFPLTNDGYSQKTQNVDGVVYNNISEACDMNTAYVAHAWSNSWVSNVWYKDPLIWNKDYWAIALFIIFFLIWFLLILFT